jgi:hypothetical protein
MAVLLSLSHCFGRYFGEGRKEILQDAAFAGLHLDRHSHARREGHGFAVHIDDGLVRYDGHRKYEVLYVLDVSKRDNALKFSGGRCFNLLGIGLGDSIVGDTDNLAFDDAKTGERECLDLDHSALPGGYKTYIAVRQIGFDLKRLISDTIRISSVPGLITCPIVLMAEAWTTPSMGLLMIIDVRRFCALTTCCERSSTRRFRFFLDVIGKKAIDQFRALADRHTKRRFGLDTLSILRHEACLCLLLRQHRVDNLRARPLPPG